MAKAAELAYRAIRLGILSGRFPPGERLPEEGLAAEIGVSRTPVREALRRLHGDGFVRFVPNHGAQVITWSSDELDEMFELRALLEGYGASLAAQRATPAQLDDLRRLAHDMQTLNAMPHPDLGRIGELNIAFHDLLLEAADSKRLAPLLPHVRLLSLTHRTFHQYSREQLQRSLAHHHELVAALEQRDPAWAKSVMRSHVFAARSAIVEAYADASLPSLAAVKGA